MRSDSILHNAKTHSSELKSKSSGSNLQLDWAKTAILTWLGTLQYGRLTFYDQGKTYTFGQTQEDANCIAHINIENPAFYKSLMFDGALGAAESYIAGEWTSPNLVDVVKVMALNLSQMHSLDSQKTFSRKMVSWLHAFRTRNTSTGSRKNISAHYDLGNDFFSLFLDPSMMYSSAIYSDEHNTLEKASFYKLDTICQKLQLEKSDHVIEIGTGWGGFAIHAAKHYGCKVSTTTISKEQFDYATQRVNEEGLSHLVTVLFDDYRDLQGEYDKLVSIEMIEAVGHQYFQNFFEKCSSLLKPEGKMLIQAITISDQRYDRATRSVDFIQKYIFPGGCLPCPSVISKNIAEHTDLQLVEIHDITKDYARTLEDWRIAFFEKLKDVKAQGFNEQFIRMWDYYLCYCQGGFEERVIQTGQYLMAKPLARF